MTDMISFYNSQLFLQICEKFKYEIKIINSDSGCTAKVKWCKEQFGPNFLERNYHQHERQIRILNINKNATWEYNKAIATWYFENKEDAMRFKLVWG